VKAISRLAVLLLSLMIPFTSWSQSASPGGGKDVAQPGREMPVTTSSKEALALFRQGRDLLDNVEAAQAASHFDKAIQADERFALAHAYRALSGGSLELRRKHVDQATQLSDGVSAGEQLWIQATRAGVYGDTAALIAANERLLAMYPDDKRVQTAVGLYYQNVGDWTRAAKHFDRAAAIDPSWAPAQNQVGFARMALGDLPGAERALRRYVELRPNSPNAHDSLGELLMKQGRFEESIASYRKALTIDPSFTSSWEGIGNCHTLRGRYVEARDAYAKGAAASPGAGGKLSPQYWRTVSYVHEGKTGEAIGSFDQARAFADENGFPGWAIWSHLHSAWILIEADAVGAAAAHLDAAAARIAGLSLPGPGQAALEVAVQRLRVMALARIHAFGEARALAQKNADAAAALKDEAAQRWLAGVQAWAALEEGKPDVALDFAGRAVRDNAWTLYQEAVARELKGQAAEARKGFVQLVHWNQNDLGYALVRAKALARAGAAQ
jgi:tetratricopeptide (TPR) repeat protein